MAPKIIKPTKKATSAKIAGKIAKVRPLGESRMARQNAVSGLGMLSLLGGQRSFTVADVIFMLDDDQIALGMDYLKIPIGHAPIMVKTSKPEAYAFACDLYKRIWEKLVPKLDMYFGYGWSCLEVLYKKDPQNLLYWDFSDFDIAPSLGAVPWVYNDRLAFASIDLTNGFNAFQMDLGVDGIQGQIVLEGAGKFRPAKALWLCNDPLLSRWYGRSVLRAAHLRWKMKNMPDGMLETLGKAMYRASYSGALIRYPAGQSVVSNDGAVVTAEEYADFLLQVIKSGSNIRLPAHIEGSPGWDIEEWAKNLVDLQKLIEPLDYVDRAMLRGMGIPDDIITHEGATGGFSRALVSVDAFYSRGETRAGTILGPVTDSIVSPLVHQRYGEDCEVTAHIMPAPRPGDDGSGNTDSDGNGIPDALEGSMGQEGDPNGEGNPDGSAEGYGPPKQIPNQGAGVQQAPPQSRFSISMSKAAKKEYSSTQFDLDAPARSLIEKMTSLIGQADLADKGIEDKPHITIKYGLHTENKGLVESIANSFPGPVKVTLGDISLFETPEYDVVKIDVESPELHRLNRAMCKLSHTDTFPGYKPHLTLAYVKPGMGQKYVAQNPLKGMELSFHTVTFSNKSRVKSRLALGID